MIAHALEKALKNLVKVAQIDNFGDVQAIDTALAEFMAFNDPYFRSYIVLNLLMIMFISLKL